jgi:hypothetical protein
MCSRARHRTTASKVKLRNGSCVADACTNRGEPPRLCASRICERVGSRPTTSAPPRAMHRATCPSPHPTSSTRRAFRRWLSTSGRICSSYSGSAPSVNLRCHHPECCSQRESLNTAARLVTYISACQPSISYDGLLGGAPFAAEPWPGVGDYHVSMQERFFPDLTGGGGLARNVSTTRRRVVAGSMTSSISNTLATFSAFPCS